jgi:glycosyltransferase involved in cell wall biosynthesis
VESVVGTEGTYRRVAKECDVSPLLETSGVTVVIPTKDGWPAVERTIAAALGQRDVELELVVVDDGSTDGTGDRLEALVDERLTIVRHAEPKGPAAARNAGLARARGAWTAFLDHDDLWAPDKLRSQLDAAEAEGAGFAFSAAITVDEELRPIRYDPAPQTVGLLADLLKHNSIPGGGSNVVARTDLLRRLGGFDESHFYLADWELWIRLAEAAAAARVPETHVGYVEHEGGMHLSWAHRGLHELETMRRKHRALWEPLGVDMGGGAWFPLWFAAGVLRSGRRRMAVGVYLRIALAYRSPGALLRAVAAPFTDSLALRDVAGRFPARIEDVPDWLLQLPLTQSQTQRSGPP